MKFLRTWDTLLADSSIESCDFLIPDLSEDGTWLSHEPLDYASALSIFRRMLSDSMEDICRTSSIGKSAVELHPSQSEGYFVVFWTSVGPSS